MSRSPDDTRNHVEIVVRWTVRWERISTSVGTVSEVGAIPPEVGYDCGQVGSTINPTTACVKVVLTTVRSSVPYDDSFQSLPFGYQSNRLHDPCLFRLYCLLVISVRVLAASMPPCALGRSGHYEPVPGRSSLDPRKHEYLFLKVATSIQATARRANLMSPKSVRTMLSPR